MPEIHPVAELEKAAMARWCNGDPDGFLEICADEVTYFDPFIARRIDGLENLRAHYDAIRGHVFAPRYEFKEIHVQDAGDFAVLTYHFHSWGGTEEALRWNCTEVYRRARQTWRIIQTHWSFQGPK